MANQDFDRSEAATPHKLQEARKKGQVAKSADVVSAVVFAVAVIYLYSHGMSAVQAQFQLNRQLLLFAGQVDLNFAIVCRLMSDILIGTMIILAPFFASVMVVAVLANLLQTGPIFSAHQITPDFERINPANGAKKLFSGRTLFELFRSCIKLALLGLIIYYALKSLFPQFFKLAELTPLGYMRVLLDDLASLGLKIAMILGLIAIVDLAYTKREFAKKMRMSRHEVKEEFKQREGDPRIRARVRELQREMRKRTAALAKTKTADVLITNPTHLAIALKYSHGEMPSPQLIAKGAGMVASVMRTIAARHNIPVVQNRALARQLFHQVDCEEYVPASLYADVARIIVWVFAARQSRATNRVQRVQEGNP